MPMSTLSIDCLRGRVMASAGALLARLRALFRHLWTSLRQQPRHLALSRLCDPFVQLQQTIRSVCHGADCRRPAAGEESRSAHRQRLRSPGPEQQRRRHHSRRVAREHCARAHRGFRRNLHGPHRRLRRVPRPQVRPHHAEGLLCAHRVLQQHRREALQRRPAGVGAGRAHSQGRRTRRRSTACWRGAPSLQAN